MQLEEKYGVDSFECDFMHFVPSFKNKKVSPEARPFSEYKPKYNFRD